jgi:hypothetical protein
MYELSGEGVQAITYHLETFKQKCATAAKDALDAIYADLPNWIESDAIRNLENQILRKLANDLPGNIESYTYAGIRERWFQEHRDEIMLHMPSELAQENDQLRAQLSYYSNRTFPSYESN